MEVTLSLPNIRIRSGELGSFPYPRNATDFVFRSCIAARFPQGMKRAEQRLWGAIYEALTEAVEGEAKRDSIEVTVDQLAFLRENMEKWESVPSPLVSWYLVVLDHLNALGNADKDVRRET